MDFSKLRREHQPFVATRENWSAYLTWSQQQVCLGCGARFADRDPRGEWWATEVECWACFTARCQNARGGDMNP